LKLQPTPTPVITGPSSGGSVSLRPVFGTGPKGDTGDQGETGPQGEQGPAGYNATGAAEDLETLTDYVNETAGPNDFASALKASMARTIGGGRYSFESFVTGTIDLTGATDYSTQLAAAHTAIASFGGGTLVFPAGTLRFNSQFVMPNDGASTYPRQQSVRWEGQGSYSDPKGGSGPFAALAGSGGTILDFRYAGRQDTATVTSGSATVTDASITAADTGLPVYGTGIPAGTFICTVTPGVSFKLSSNPITQTDVLATTNGTSIRVGLPKIDTRGKGTFEITGLTITDQGTSSNPFLRTTNSKLHLHDMAFSGNPSKSGTTCDQDAIVLGGVLRAAGGDSDGTVNGPFQGYGTQIVNVHFDRIRRAALFQLYANAIVMRDCNIWITCGSNLAGGSAIELASAWGGTVDYISGNVIAGNLIEVNSYVYPIKVDWAFGCSFLANNFYDGSAAFTLAQHRFASNKAKDNIVISGYAQQDIPLVSEQSTGLNSWMGNTYNIPSQYSSVPSYIYGIKTAGWESAFPEVTYGKQGTVAPSVWTGNNRPPTTGTAFAAAKRGSLYHVKNGFPGTSLFLKELDSTGGAINPLGPFAALPVRIVTAGTNGSTMTIDNTLTDCVVILNRTGGITATLPTAVTDGGIGGSNLGKRYIIKNVHATSVTIACTGAETIDGATTKTLAQWEKMTVMSDGANWVIIA
jgi:hypothetical protein